MAKFLPAAKGHGMSTPDVNVNEALGKLICRCNANVRDVSQARLSLYMIIFQIVFLMALFHDK